MIPKSGNRFSEKIMLKQNASMPERPGGEQPAVPCRCLRGGGRSAKTPFQFGQKREEDHGW
jgi:hypothetical protein